MSHSKPILALFTLTLLFSFFVIPDLLVWPVLVPLAVFAFLVELNDGWNDRYIYALVGIDVLVAVFTHLLPLPFEWLVSIQVPFGLAILFALATLFAYLTAAIGLVAFILALLRRTLVLSK